MDKINLAQDSCKLGLFWTREWNFSLHKMQGIWLAEELFTGLWSRTQLQGQG